LSTGEPSVAQPFQPVAPRIVEAPEPAERSLRERLRLRDNTRSIRVNSEPLPAPIPVPSPEQIPDQLPEQQPMQQPMPQVADTKPPLRRLKETDQWQDVPAEMTAMPVSQTLINSSGLQTESSFASDEDGWQDVQ